MLRCRMPVVRYSPSWLCPSLRASMRSVVPALLSATETSRLACATLPCCMPTRTRSYNSTSPITCPERCSAPRYTDITSDARPSRNRTKEKANPTNPTISRLVSITSITAVCSMPTRTETSPEVSSAHAISSSISCMPVSCTRVGK